MQLTKKNLLKSHTGNERYARYNSCCGSVAVTMNNTVITVRMLGGESKTKTQNWMDVVH